jgi:diguanylate cyclase (GGDEF)-like protein/PAS domain S-box-containing protein
MGASIPQSRALAWVGAVAVGYFALAWVGLQLLDPNDQTAVIWPSAGLALGMLVVLPRQLWPQLAAAVVVANFLAQLFVRDASVPLSALISLAGMLQSVGAALLMGWIAGPRPRIGSKWTVAGLFAAAGIAGLLAALLAAAGLVAETSMGYGDSVVGWWLGNAIGMLVVAPLILALTFRCDLGSGRLEAAVLVALTAAVALLLFWHEPGTGAVLFSFGDLVLPFLLWCAVRAGARATAIAALLVAAIASYATVHDHGPFAAAQFDGHERAMVLQGFLALAMLTTLVVGAVVSDQRWARQHADTEAERLAEALATLRRTQADLQTVFERAPIGHAILDVAGRLGDANPALAAITGYELASLRERHVKEILCEADRDEGCAMLDALASGELTSGSLNVALVHRDGRHVDVAAYLAVLDAADSAPRTLLQVVDVSERKRLEAQLRELADHDPLTGLLNRRGFDKALDAHVERARRYGDDGAVVMLDLDEFKQINDTRGHHAGDQLLVAVATLLTGRLRASDVVARFGGDEFAILLPHVGRAEAALIADQLVAGVRAELDVTISLGIAIVGGAGRGAAADLLIAADRAMYEAKSAGRDGHAFAVEG